LGGIVDDGIHEEDDGDVLGFEFLNGVRPGIPEFVGNDEAEFVLKKWVYRLEGFAVFKTKTKKSKKLSGGRGKTGGFVGK
jgi:hypothetical protein